PCRAHHLFPAAAERPAAALTLLAGVAHRLRRDVGAEGERVADPLHWLERAAGAAHHQRAVAEEAAEDALVDIDALDLGAVHLDGVAGEDAALEDHALVGDGELGGGPTDRRRDGGDDGEHQHHPGQAQDDVLAEDTVLAGMRHIERADRERRRDDEEHDRPAIDQPMEAGLIDDLLPRQQDLAHIAHRRPSSLPLAVTPGYSIRPGAPPGEPRRLPSAPCTARPICTYLRQPDHLDGRAMA